MSKLTFEEYLLEKGELTYRNTGVSMLPMLKQGRDLFTVERKTEKRCSKYDVVMYRRPPDQYVLHRIVKVRDNDYVICGDNCINREYGITDDDIIGVMKSFVRKGKTHYSDDFLYRLYSRLWVGTFAVRRFFMIAKIKFKRRL